MAELANSAGLASTEIEEHNDCVTVRFRRADYAPPRRGGNDALERQEAILTLLDRADKGLPLREIVAALGTDMSRRQVLRTLAALRSQGLARASGRGPAARWGSYWGLIPATLQPFKVLETPFQATFPENSGQFAITTDSGQGTRIPQPTRKAPLNYAV